MNGVPLVGHQAMTLIPCPAEAPHIALADDGQVEPCRFCGGYGVVLANTRALKILEIHDDAQPQASQAEAAPN